MKQTIRMKDMPACEMPRERLLKKGAGNLTTAELIAVLIQTGSGDASALDLARRLLCMDESKGVQFLSGCTPEELMSVKGIGPAKTCQVLAAVELGRRICSGGFEKKRRVTSPEIIAEVFMPEMRHLMREEFRVCYLNTKNEITAWETVSVGSLNASIVHPREVFSNAIRRSAASVILIHNHPSGNPEPSREDKDITKRLSESGLLLGIRVLDHVIIGRGKWYSMKSHGDM